MGQQAATDLRFIRLGTIAIALALLFAIGAARADAAPSLSGQQEVWPEKGWGEDKNSFFDPLMLGVDSTDGSVYIGDISETFENVRIQKFSASGEFKAVTSGIPSAPSGVIGVAVDPGLKKFYVLQTQMVSGSEWVAEKILAFSTEQTGESFGAPVEIDLPTTGTDALINPGELIVDPHNHDLVITARDEAEHPVIEMVDHDTGAQIGRYTEVGSLIAHENFGVAVDDQGIPYVVTAAAGQDSIRAYTLPADFGSTLSLTPVPGFEDAVTGEEWPSNPQFKLIAIPVSVRLGHGSQVAVDSTPTGDVLYFQTEKSFVSETLPGIFYVHGYSIPGKATSVIYGGGTAEPDDCAIQSQGAAIAVGPGESLVVLDRGENVEEEETLPGFTPQVIRFGPQTSGLGCPVPAAGLELLDGSTPVDTVEAGKTVTMDASSSDVASQTLTSMTWVIEGPGGIFKEKTEAAPTESLNEVFTTPGTYTIRLKMKTSAPVGLGNTVSTAKTLEVTGAGVVLPVVSSINPTKGPAAGGTTVTITGEHLTGTTAVEFGTTAATSFDEVSGSEVTAVAPPGIGGTKAKIKVTTGEGSAESLTEFEWTAPAIVKHKLTINPAGDGSGRVTCNGGECATEYAEGTVVRLTATPNAGSDFSGWQGAGCSGTGVCTVTIGAADVAVTATFKKAPTDNPPDDNHPGDNPPSSNPPSKDAPPVGTKPPSGTPKTPAQKLKEKRQKAIAKCMKLKGKSRAKCMKRANQIGKPKKKAKKARAGEGNQVLGGWSFW